MAESAVMGGCSWARFAAPLLEPAHGKSPSRYLQNCMRAFLHSLFFIKHFALSPTCTPLNLAGKKTTFWLQLRKFTKFLINCVLLIHE